MTARTIDIAGIRLRFFGNAAALDVIDNRYSAFATAAVGDAVEIELQLRPLNARTPGIDKPLDVMELGGNIVFEGGGLCAEVAPDRMSARVTAPLAERPIDAVVRFLLASQLLARGGLLVHASAVRIEGRAWVFAGPSGAGKSTLGAELDGELLCDEAVALLPSDDGVVAHSTPYWRSTPGCAPVAGLVFPVRSHDPRAAPRWRALTSAQAVARLLPAAGPLMERATPEVLGVAAGLVGSIPCAQVTLSTVAQIRDWLQARLEPAPIAGDDGKIGVVAT